MTVWMKTEEYKAEIGEIALEIEDIDLQIAGLHNLKKQKKEELRRLRQQMIEAVRMRKAE